MIAVALYLVQFAQAFDTADHYALLQLLVLVDRRLPCNSIAIVYNWFLRFPFSVRAGASQGSLLSPVVFSIYIDVLIARLKSANVRCKLLDNYYGHLLCADDIVLLRDRFLKKEVWER